MKKKSLNKLFTFIDVNNMRIKHEKKYKNRQILSPKFLNNNS